jgi:hypothetical protein
MTASQPVERVVAMLQGAGYDRLPQPVEVAGIPFEFSAVMAAKAALDLIVVLDTITESNEASIRLRIEGLGRALDLVESRRPLTVVLVGPEPMPDLHVALTRVARVLAVGVPSEQRDLHQALAVLLPLELRTVAEMPESWQSAREKLLTAHPAGAEVLDAAKHGAEEVTNAARELLLRGDSKDGT